MLPIGTTLFKSWKLTQLIHISEFNKKNTIVIVSNDRTNQITLIQESHQKVGKDCLKKKPKQTSTNGDHVTI